MAIRISNGVKKNTGFTLIELLVTMTVITILIGVSFGAIREVQVRGRDTRRIADLKSVQVGLELYINRCGRYPGDATCGSTNPSDWAQLTTALGAVMDTNKVPKDPTSSRTYYYGVDKTAGQEGLRYVIGAKLERESSVLQDDLDIDTYGVPCSDTSPNFYYCIQS